VKRRELVTRIERIARDKGLTAIWTEGGRHSKVDLGRVTVSVPRHTEINEDTARAILNQVRKA